MDYLKHIRERHAAMIAPFTGSPQGCTDVQIRALEARLGFSLPLAYVQFLRWMGEDAQGMFVGSDCFIRHVEQNTRHLSTLLAENGVRFQLPPHYLAFFSHQGYTILWFELPADSDDPVCWYYSEGHTPEPSKTGRFTEWLREYIEAVAPVIADVHSRAN